MFLRFLFVAFLLLLGCGDLEFNNPKDPFNISHPGGIEYKSFTDERDGKTYKSVVIGTQTWMAENLNYAADGSYCIDNVEYKGKTSYIQDTLVNNGGYCNIYGRLYYNPDVSICPKGWHLPSYSELQTLASFATYSSKLKSTYESGTDDYGFTALSNFCCLGDGSYLYLSGSNISVGSGSGGYPGVRCIKDPACGSKTFSPATQFCNSNTVYDKCNGSVYNPTNQRCKDNVLEFKCGGTEWYSSLTYQCEGDDDVNKVLKTRCGSGGYFYDATNPNYRCQNNVVESKCGTGWYNTANQRCGENNVVETRCGTGWYDATNSNLRCQNNVIETKCGTEWFNALTQRCGTGNVIETKCGTEWFNASTQRCGTGNVIETKCGTSWFNALTQRCGTGNVVETKCGTGWYSASNLSLTCENDVMKCKSSYDNTEKHYCSNGTMKEYGSMTDGVQTYKTVEIGTQIWMAENLNYATEDSKCYNSSAANCTYYGRLYYWSTAKTVCPSGWHLPSSAEWAALSDYIGGPSSAGTKLKKADAWYPYSGVARGSDNYGFAAMPGGYSSNGSLFQTLNEQGRWWSATVVEDNNSYAYVMEMYYRNEYATLNGLSASNLFSVRCLKGLSIITPSSSSVVSSSSSVPSSSSVVSSSSSVPSSSSSIPPSSSSVVSSSSSVPSSSSSIPPSSSSVVSSSSSIVAPTTVSTCNFTFSVQNLADMCMESKTGSTITSSDCEEVLNKIKTPALGMIGYAINYPSSCPTGQSFECEDEEGYVYHYYGSVFTGKTCDDLSVFWK